MWVLKHIFNHAQALVHVAAAAQPSAGGSWDLQDLLCLAIVQLVRAADPLGKGPEGLVAALMFALSDPENSLVALLQLLQHVLDIPAVCKVAAALLKRWSLGTVLNLSGPGHDTHAHACHSACASAVVDVFCLKQSDGPHNCEGLPSSWLCQALSCQGQTCRSNYLIRAHLLLDISAMNPTCLPAVL